jgi:hypothetical protein
MYFASEIKLDPSQETVLNPVRPTQAFGRLFFYLSAGHLSKKEEQETFTAVAILQQLNRALRSVGVDNIVRLSKDEVDFYFDEEGREDDLKEAMDRFGLETDRYESELFDTLYLVVEHRDNIFKYLIEVEINRTHSPGEPPIKMTMNAVPVDFDANDGAAALETKLDGVFASQESYDSFQLKRQAHFDAFVARLRQALSGFVRCDSIEAESQARVIRPTQPVREMGDMEYERRAAAQSQPLYHGYAGFDNYFFYAWMWSSMSHQNHIHYHNVTVVDSQGEPVFDVGAEGFDAGEGAAMDPSQDFAPPEGNDLDFHGGHGYQDAVDEISIAAGSEGDGGGSWLEGSGDSGDSGGGDSGGSSCSSCSSCGGD